MDYEGQRGNDAKMWNYLYTNSVNSSPCLKMFKYYIDTNVAQCSQASKFSAACPVSALTI